VELLVGCLQVVCLLAWVSIDYYNSTFGMISLAFQ
jgi:DNA-binding transcriptional regulator of glucitol operon